MLFNKVVLTIICCGIVAILSRVLPFVLLKYVHLSDRLVEFLDFVPIVIMTTLWFSNLFIPHLGHLPTLNLEYLLASLPTFLAAIVTKNLLLIVLVGIISLAILRTVI
ncbi:AzlD domain-containing protein [Bombilactobacillus mellis]|uniref:AzlD domain-containing protein n=1 Tax=Bombilactobacillus mellis TaxID=1218508 RepID=UPI001580927B|nr:AzlD domain-containing protein [Bombilactobacillus mellis]NUF26111.1 AzlD domain-containing protein [Bombilactobacillus mellis]